MSDLTLSVSDAELEQYRDAVNPMRQVRDVLDFMHEVLDIRVHKIANNRGDSLPWERAQGVSFRPGEVTLWMGINGHGKSAITAQFALWLALQNKRSCIASFEMLPKMTVDRMLCQAAGGSSPTIELAWDFFAALTGKVWIYDRRDSVNLPMLYAVIRYCALEKGVTHFFVDSLMKCVRGEDDYNGQKDFVADVCSLARELGIHIHLVHHVRKSGAEKDIPGKFDAKGSGAITDQVDQVLTVWRNKAKEQDRANGKADEEMPDFLLICDKNRNGGWEGRIPLWGDLESWHFRGTSKQPWTRGYEIPKRKLKEAA